MLMFQQNFTFSNQQYVNINYPQKFMERLYK